jgi:hypothetical protein
MTAPGATGNGRHTGRCSMHLERMRSGIAGGPTFEDVERRIQARLRDVDGDPNRMFVDWKNPHERWAFFEGMLKGFKEGLPSTLASARWLIKFGFRTSAIGFLTAPFRIRQ